MTTQPAWAVAAAILYSAKAALDVKSLTKQVMETGLSGLGLKGETPWATLGVQLKQETTPRLFEFRDDGYVGLLHPMSAVGNPKVRAAVESLSALQTRDTNLRNYLFPEELPADEPVIEGASRTVVVNAFERSPEARRACINAHGTTCAACGMSFGAAYGVVADGYIHVHHLRPLSEVRTAHAIDPVADLLPVCPNCHAVIHRRVPPFRVEEVRAFWQQMHPAPSTASDGAT